MTDESRGHWVLGAALLLVAAGAAPARASAPRPPAPEAVQATWDYFYRGQGQGPLLVDARLCTEVGTEGAQRLECLAEVTAGGVKAGTIVKLWQSYLVPQGDRVDDVRVEVRQGSVVRATKDVTLRGDGWRARTWTAVPLSKPGAWTLSIQHRGRTLRTFEVTVF